VYFTDCRALTADRFLLPELVGDNKGLGISATKQNEEPITITVSGAKQFPRSTCICKGFGSTTVPDCSTLHVCPYYYFVIMFNLVHVQYLKEL